MSESNAPDPVIKAAATDSGPIAKELACWLNKIRTGWTQSVEDTQRGWTDGKKHCFRLVYALSGSFTWLVGTTVLVLGDPRFLNLINIQLLTAFAAPVLILFAAWLGWLVAFADRGAGPIRLFLDGILLPTATITLIALSAQRIQTPPAETPESSNAPPSVTLQPPEPPEDDSEPENAPEPENPDDTTD